MENTSQHWPNNNNFNGDNMMCVKVWLNPFVVYFDVKTHDIWERNVIT